jgi:hypothetical protein
MAHWPNLTPNLADALDRIKGDDDDAPAEADDYRVGAHRRPVSGHPEGRGGEAELVAQARQIVPKRLPEPKGLLPTDEDQAAALEALAALFVVAREGFDPAGPGVPYLGGAHRSVEAPNPVRQATPDAWSTTQAVVGPDPITIVGRNPARVSLLILNPSGPDVIVSPGPGGQAGFTIAAGATFALDCTGPVYGRSATAAR